MKSTKSIREILSEDEIQLADIWALFWNKRKYIFISVVIFGVIGFIAANTTPKEYSAKCILLGEEGGGGGGNSGGGAAAALAGLAGIPAPAASSGSVSDLYPIILSNQTFLVELAKDTLYLDDNTKTTLMDYFQKPLSTDAITSAKIFISEIPNTIAGWFRSKPKPAPVVKGKPELVVNKPEARLMQTTIADVARDAISPLGDSQTLSVVVLSSRDIQIGSILKSRVKLAQNGRQIILSVNTPEARLSAEAAKLALNKLIQYVIKYKTKKQLQNLNFLESRAAEASSRYKSDQQKVAGFADNNYGVVYQSVKSKESQLQNEFNISFNTYNQLAAQLEQARIDLKKQTPLFTILEPVYIPSGPAPVNVGGIILMHIAIGVVVGMVIIFGLIFLSYVRDDKKARAQEVASA